VSSDPRRPERPKGPLRAQAIDAVEAAREALAKQIAEIDPDLLVELTVGVKSRAESPEASWTDSWGDRFVDNGKFSDLWINLSGARGAISLPGPEEIAETLSEPDAPQG
jgi:hypothetical protein